MKVELFSTNRVGVQIYGADEVKEDVEGVEYKNGYVLCSKKTWVEDGKKFFVLTNGIAGNPQYWYREV